MSWGLNMSWTNSPPLKDEKLIATLESLVGDNYKIVENNLKRSFLGQILDKDGISLTSLAHQLFNGLGSGSWERWGFGDKNLWCFYVMLENRFYLVLTIRETKPAKVEEPLPKGRPVQYILD